ncbi:Bug family tripartite tricarboxylate transporter substrate binding protein [Pollutimonas bauzanensis]|uniref:Tripartite-type tricarboxylate transporter, receptor component TctC n=1 Tax=Pollutimonas bauzanensis TaxID=658167 RepID=A0A1M5Y722_9BURK|nr:tripartite tricarboxylate transporter substrate binding protein [Pollutimonas bauzanensis]SHI07880.1 Tripartite-type tricarboxylate transporter, receptor component TctC [Pollutimonas bauzanensis]
MTYRSLLHAVLPCALALAALAGPSIGAAQEFPSKPMRILVGASPGGGTDILARVLAEKFSAGLKQAVVVENRPGASNTIAAGLTARDEPNGLTLLVATNTGQAIAPHLIKLSYDPLKNLQPVGLVAIMPNVLVVSSSSPYKSVQDVLAAMKAKPGELKFASSGVGSTQHVGAEAFNLATGAKSIHIPYKGSSQAHMDVISGQVDMMFDSTSSAMSQIVGGKLRALAVTSPKRSAALPDVPTLAEQGITGADVNTWYGLFATGGTPPAIIARLHDELTKSLETPEVQARIKALGGEIELMSVEQFAAMNQKEYDRYGQLLVDSGIKKE